MTTHLAAAQAVAVWQTAGSAAELLAGWARIFARLIGLVTGAQVTAASGAERYARAVLARQGYAADDRYAVDPALFAGTAADGRSLESLLDLPRQTVTWANALGLEDRVALGRGQVQLAQIVRSEVADAGRVADGAATVAAGASGFYRMLQPPSCARCAVLAGKFYRYNRGFKRHPRCDCVHIPAAEADDSLAFDPQAYFESLTQAEQDKVFTIAGAQAIRDGANVGQVVNARRGMRTASVGGRKILATTEGVTRRGWHTAVQRAIDSATQFQRNRGERYFRNTKPRLMPEQIYSLADEQGWDRDETLRQLTRNGFLLDRKDAPGAHPLARIGNALNP